MNPPSRPSSLRVLSIATALLAWVGSLLLGPSASAASPQYVALGDSYSSGTGTRSYLADGTTCQRSAYAYPSLLSAARGYALNFRACSGATVADVTSYQLAALSSTTDYVTISVGGNDAGFADVLTECALPWWASDCQGTIDRAQSFISRTLPGRLSTLYAAIRARAPQARVVVVGYPRLFQGEDCNALTFFSGSEMSRLNQTADLLNARAGAVATASGLAYANPTGRFVGHAVCADVAWLNGLSHPVSESYHPNRSGHAAGYAPTVSEPLTGATLAVTPRTLRAARGSAAEQSARQRDYAQFDRLIQPEVFRLPDLDSPALRTAARRAGIDVERWRSAQELKRD